MRYEVIVSNEAENDLRGIVEYIALYLQLIDVAKDKLIRLEAKIFSFF